MTSLPQIQAEAARLSTGAVEQVDLGFTTEESVLLSDGAIPDGSSPLSHCGIRVVQRPVDIALASGAFGFGTSTAGSSATS